MTALSNAARNAACNAVVDLADAGAGPGKLVFLTAADVVVATITLPDPAFGDAAAGVAVTTALESDPSPAGGTITKAVLVDSDDTIVLTCTITATGGGGDIELTSVTLAVGEKVEMADGLSHTQPA